jgi:NADH-quinone oxidoreductase subunit A
MLQNYVPILIFIGIAVGLGAVILFLGRVLAPHRPDREKNSPYECGFEPFEDARMKFDVRYYLIAILFIIFDLEIAFLVPWAVALDEIGLFGFVQMMIFLAVFVVVFIYAWKKGALEWE